MHGAEPETSACQASTWSDLMAAYVLKLSAVV